MGDVVEEVRHHMPETFLGDYVFLATDMAITSLHDRATIEAILFSAFRDMRHGIFD